MTIAAIACLCGSLSASAQPSVDATLTDTLTNDADSDTVADPGDTLRYQADIDNTGDADAEGTMFDLILDPNTTLVPGSLNVSPLALDDAYVVLQNGTLDVSDPGEGLFANDLEFLGDTFSLGSADSTSAEGGVVTVNADGTFTYTPPSGFSGEDSFTYTLVDSESLGSGPAVVTVTVNVCPVLQDDAISTAADTVASGSVFDDNGNGADTDPDGGTLEVIAVNGSDSDVGTEITLASGALLTLNSDGSFSYDPNSQFDTVGDGEDDTDSFTYTADDGTGLCAETATVTVTITGVNECPVAEDDDATTDEESPLNGDVLADNGNGADSDTDANDTLTVAAVNGNAAD
ncbi:MAG: cadherin-like domain-containing protein, partial [Candidatus Hydrogenedentes bacterium]|nr:cadherin-like domain-containing protein [Candidatus Hydrogenedentota bacterium]